MKQQSLPSKKKQVYCYSILFSFLLLSACSKTLHWSRAEPQSYVIESSAVDSGVLEMIAPYQQTMSAEMDEVIGQCVQTMDKAKPEGGLCNWLADAMKVQTEKFTGKTVDLALSNYGGVRINSIEVGPITRGKVFEVMPFDNLIVILEMTGVQLQDLLNHIAEDGGWPVSKELRFTIDQKTATNVTISGRPLDPSATYRIVTSDYLANGGDGLFYLKDLPRESPNFLLRDALIADVRDVNASGEGVRSMKDGRIAFAGSH